MMTGSHLEYEAIEKKRQISVKRQKMICPKVSLEPDYFLVANVCSVLREIYESELMKFLTLPSTYGLLLMAQCFWNTCFKNDFFRMFLADFASTTRCIMSISQDYYTVV